MVVIIKRKSIFYESLFLTNPYLFLTNPDLWNYIFRFIWNVYICISIYWALIVIIYSHLLLSFLLINWDNVRSPLFWLFLYFAYIFWSFFLLTNPEFYSTPFSIFITASMYTSFFKSFLIFLFRRLEVFSYLSAL